jgi:tyrosyl-tRNA synthetase
MDVYGEFEWRGLVYNATEGVRDVLAREQVTAYSGFDPTGPSLHVGHLLPALTLARLQRHGHTPIAIVGGGTGLIGDPSGKTNERKLLSVDEVETNVESIRGQLSRFLDFTAATNQARLVNNAEWLTKMSAMEFLRDVGKYFTVNAMLARESVKRRIASEEGISYTEFSYSLLQAYDFLVLHDRFGCTLQIGGSDQWGNIVSGCDLIRRLRGAKAHGLVMPLLTTAAGAKFGKTEDGAVWLDPELTKPYDFYQFWFNASDTDAVTYLKFFTFLDARQIAELEALGGREPERRHTQRALAREVTRMVHGEAVVREAESAAEKLFRGDLRSMSAAELLEIFRTTPSSHTQYLPTGWLIADFLTSNHVTTSKSEAARLIRGGGISVNDERVTDEKLRLSPERALHGRFFVVTKGKKDKFLIHIDRD